MQCSIIIQLFSNIGINNMKVFILSLLAIFLIICILYYEYFQITKQLKNIREQKEHFYNDPVVLEETISDDVNIINDGGNTATSAVCAGVDISNKPQNIETMNTLFSELNTNLNRMTDNVLSYYNLL